MHPQLSLNPLWLKFQHIFCDSTINTLDSVESGFNEAKDIIALVVRTLNAGLVRLYFPPGIYWYCGCKVRAQNPDDEKTQMKRLLIFLTVLAVLSVPSVYAKRRAPAKVRPVTSGKIEYRAPVSMMGCIEAWDTGSDEMIWRRQVYVVRYTVGLERDIQDVFITATRLKDKTLIVSNERKSEYELDLDTLEVKVLKGALVETEKLTGNQGPR